MWGISWLAEELLAFQEGLLHGVIIIIIIIINILVITFMQDIYNYTPETNHVSSVQSVAAVLQLQFVLHVMLLRLWYVFCTFTLALPAVCVQCEVCFLFCSSLISYFPGMLLRYCPSDFEMVLLLLLLLLLQLPWTRKFPTIPWQSVNFPLGFQARLKLFF
jgi:hypothetical protein